MTTVNVAVMLDKASLNRVSCQFASLGLFGGGVVSLAASGARFPGPLMEYLGGDKIP